MCSAQDAGDLFFGSRRGILRQIGEVRLLHIPDDVFTTASAKYDDVDERIRSQPVCTMDGYASALTSRIQTLDWRVLLVADHPTVNVGWNPAHRVVCSRLHWHQFSHGIDPEIHAHEVSDVGQLLVDHVFAEMSEI